MEMWYKSLGSSYKFNDLLQSGNNKQLKAMRRRYKRELYAQRVAWIKECMPHACIGVDVIVGFPGETHDDFLETYRFIQDLDVSYLHVFTYSERANTPAAMMDGIVPLGERRDRNEMLRILSEKKKRAFYEPFQGQVRAVLFEHAREEGMVSGFTDNYLKIEMPGSDDLINQMAQVELLELLPSGQFRAKLSQKVLV
ncbi:MAG: radical SAM protein, partial [Bacteroidota bacterium]